MLVEQVLRLAACRVSRVVQPALCALPQASPLHLALEDG